jgi:hypothetical protein
MAEIVEIKDTEKKKEKSEPKKKARIVKFGKPEKHIQLPPTQNEIMHFEQMIKEQENRRSMIKEVKNMAILGLSMPIKKDCRQKLYSNIRNNVCVNNYLENKLQMEFMQKLNNDLLFFANYGLCYLDALKNNSPNIIYTENVNSQSTQPTEVRGDQPKI